MQVSAVPPVQRPSRSHPPCRTGGDAGYTDVRRDIEQPAPSRRSVLTQSWQHFRSNDMSFILRRDRSAALAAVPPKAGGVPLDQFEQAVQGGGLPGLAGGRSGAQRKRRRDLLPGGRPAQAQICRQPDLAAVDQPDSAVPRKFSGRVEAVRREGGKKISRLRTELRSSVARTRPLEHVIAGLQLGEILDTFADTSLKCFLQRKADPGNPDHGTTRMHRIGQRGIKLGPKAHQAWRVGCGEFENARKPGRRSEQANAVVGLGGGIAALHRQFVAVA